jgi:DNA-binding transcriptional ArsR family regulator
MSSDTARHDPPVVGTSSPQVLRALAHPVRLDLLDLLRLESPLTASQCGDRLGLSPKVCSYHLHTLSKYGFVKETGEGKGRARPWCLVPMRVGYTHRPDDGTRLDHVGNEFAQVLLTRDADIVNRFITGRHHLDAEWRNVSTMSSSRLLISADQLAALSRGLMELLEQYETTVPDPTDDARPVRVALYAIPELAPFKVDQEQAEEDG